MSEPKIIYVNEYQSGYSVYTTEDKAVEFFKEEEGLRCAVRYVEFPEESDT